MIAIVVAHSSNRVIGRDGGLPWRLPADMRHFRELTSGHTVLMGRRTFESLPDAFRPLPNRRNLVLSRDPAYRAAGAEVFATLEDALGAAGEECFVIGGELTYRDVLPRCERLYATEIEAELDGDAFFPEVADGEWRCVERSEPLTEDDLRFTFKTYERAGPLYNLEAARGPEQLERMRRLESDGVCIFCLEHAADMQREPVEHIGEHWYVTRNDFPYEGTDAHYLIVARRHVASFQELPDEAGAELWAIRRELAGRLGAAAFATVERSGDMHLNGGSVEHLHVHVVALGETPARTVRFRVSAHGES